MRYIATVLCCMFLSTAAHAVTVTTKLACRAAASRTANIVEQLSAGTHVTVIGQRKTWSNIERRRDCWVASRFLAAEAAGASAYYPSPRYRSQASTRAETRRANRRSLAAVRRSYSGARQARHSTPSNFGGGSCPCSGGNVCIGPRGGRYCITSGGNKRYGV